MRTPEQSLRGSDPADQTAVASYVATLSADLSVMARSTGLTSLGYCWRWCSSKRRVSRAPCRVAPMAGARAGGASAHLSHRHPELLE